MDNIFDPKISKAWNEALIKEKKIRLKWHEEYYGSKTTTGRADLEDEGKKEAATTRRTAPQEEKKRMEWPRTGATGTNTLIRVGDHPSEMIEPSTYIKNKLYVGISHDGKGRIGYLQRRYKCDPDQRYKKPICSSWCHGWKGWEENELSCKDPEKCNIRLRAFKDL